MPNIAIAVPLSEFTPSNFWISLMALMEYSRRRGFNLSYSLTSTKPLCLARNTIVYEAVSREVDYIFWLDSDMFIQPNTLERLYDHNLDIVSALYFQKVYPYRPVARRVVKLENGEYDCELYDDIEIGKGLVEGANGLGAVLIKTDVFRTVFFPPFHFDIKYDKDTFVSKLVSEDIYFFKNAYKKGFKAWIDTNIICRHIGGEGLGWENHQYGKTMEDERRKRGEKSPYDDVRTKPLGVDYK